MSIANSKQVTSYSLVLMLLLQDISFIYSAQRYRLTDDSQIPIAVNTLFIYQ